ncbi:MAG: UbiA family prenyltransferase [Alphaproteobacteria bacterium]
MKIFYIFLLFSLFVSSTYIFNDIRDVKLDKFHPSKKHRPIASGAIDKKSALTLGVSIFTFALMGAYLITPSSYIYFLLYAFATLLYTLKFKYIFLVDTVLISLMFVIRIFIGGLVSGIELTTYLIIFVFFTSCLLSFSKKISIVNTKGNEKNNFFIILNKQNQKYGFKNLYLFFSLLSLVSLIFWFVDLSKDGIAVFEKSMLSFAILAFTVFLSFVYKFSKLGKLEDFSSEIIKNKVLFIFSLLIIMSFSLGYF